jgi:hypothetical protein
MARTPSASTSARTSDAAIFENVTGTRTPGVASTPANFAWAAGGNRAIATLIGSLHAFQGVQRKCAECEQEEETLRRSPKEGALPGPPLAEAAPPDSESHQPTEPAAGQAESPASTSAPALVVDDETVDVAAGQMRKTEFLAELRGAVCATANEGMAATGQTTDACPWMDHWFDTAAAKGAGYVEKGIRKFAPETRGASTARDLIPIAAARVRHSVDHWARTGEIGDLPEGATPDLPGAGLFSSVAGLLFKARPGGARSAEDPETIRAQLGSGHPLSGGTRSRMEAAFGLSFGRVRFHTDRHAASISDQLNARAFAIGEHVAFGAGEYKPGTLVGDALIAHELAHVVQQGAARAAAPQRKGNDNSSALEHDADRAAGGVIRRLWAGTGGERAAPRQQSGLRLNRCSKPAPKPTLPSQPTKADQKNACQASPIRIEVRKPADYSDTFSKRASETFLASSAIEFLVPLNATDLTVGEEVDALLIWSCPDGKSGSEKANWTHKWTRAGNTDLPTTPDGKERVGIDTHLYGLAGGAGATARQAAEKKGFDMDTCSWEFTENFRGTPTLRAGEQVLHHCVYGFQFRATQTATGKGKPARSASAQYWGVDLEEVSKGMP